MGIESAIAWTKSTFVPWVGCTKVGPGCDNCYAEATNRRWKAGENWGPGAPRTLMSDKYWTGPLKWARKAKKNGEVWPVFVSSQSDVFDNEVDDAWRDRLWKLIKATPELTWLVVTKRIGNAYRMLPADWGNGYPNVCIIATIVNQEEADRDTWKLLSTPARWHGVSYEPGLGPINFEHCVDSSGVLNAFTGRYLDSTRRARDQRGKLDWLIVGGESRQLGKCRDFNIAWAFDLLDQCVKYGCAYFFKQMGHRPIAPVVEDGVAYETQNVLGITGKGDNPEEWPERLRRREFPPDFIPNTTLV